MTGEPIRPCPRPPKREAKARKPLKRSWIKRKRPKRLQRGLGNPAYMAFVRTLPCLMQEQAQALCRQPIHAHHAINRARGGKDDTCVPLCELHHSDWHHACGVFRRLNRLERFAWSMRAIAETQAAYKARTP